jgi:hypothetical protein
VLRCPTGLLFPGTARFPLRTWKFLSCSEYSLLWHCKVHYFVHRSPHLAPTLSCLKQHNSSLPTSLINIFPPRPPSDIFIFVAI